MKPTYLLAVDQGTSGTKAVVFDAEARRIAVGFEELRSFYPRRGFVEQDPGEIYESALRAVRRCVERFERTAGARRSEIRFCGITNQRETFLLWDRAGNPFHPAVVWQCKRSLEICERIRRTPLEEEIREKTGLMADPYFSGTKVQWLRDHVVPVRDAIRSGRAYGGTVDTWLLFRLTGGRRYETDYTNASRTLLFDIDCLAWDEGLISAFGLEGLNLPEPHPSAGLFGESTFEGIFPEPLPITALIGDSHAAAFGEACFEAGDVKATLGTGCSILMNTGGARVRSGGGLVSTICWSLPGRTAYALEGIIVSAGATVKWLRDQLGLFDDAADSEGMATSVPDNHGVYLIPAFSGLGAPHWKMDRKAVIAGLTFGADKNHIVRAALESIPYQIRDATAAMEAEAGLILRELMTDGGMTSNGFVMQLAADLLGAPVTNIGLEEVSALGAAALAGLGGGLYLDLDEVRRLPHERRRFVPGDRRPQALEGYRGWRAALEAHV